MNELVSLDHLISWGLQYGVHIQLCNMSIPGRGTMGYFYGELYTDDEYYPSSKEWDILKEYWVMMAMRYKDISSDNLTFDLMNEWHPDSTSNHLEDFTKHWGEIVAAIREVDPNRVLCASFDGDLDAAKVLAKLGVCIEYHAYVPRDFTAEDKNATTKTWPFTDSQGKTWSCEDVWKDILPYYELAKDNKVGFMISEWGVFKECGKPAIVDYTRDMVKMFAEHNIGWCHYQLQGQKSLVYDLPIFGDGVTPHKVTYQFKDYTQTFYEDAKYMAALKGN